MKGAASKCGIDKERKMSDMIVRATAADDTVRAFAIDSRELVECARTSHDTSPVVTAALGRLLSGAAMMGVMMKDERDLITVQIIGDGPIGRLTVTADNAGNVKGFPQENMVEVPLKYEGKLNVGAAVGNGILRVMRDIGAPEPFVGTVDLVSGEIAEDLTYYFAQSEQTPSVVGLGVLIEKDLSVAYSGGFIVQLMPDATDETITVLEENIKGLKSVTEMLSAGLSPEQILEEVLNGLNPRVLETKPACFKCDCSRERIEESLISLPASDLTDMINDGKPVEVRCQFCNRKYEFSVDDITKLRDSKS